MSGVKQKIPRFVLELMLNNEKMKKSSDGQFEKNTENLTSKLEIWFLYAKVEFPNFLAFL